MIRKFKNTNSNKIIKVLFAFVLLCGFKNQKSNKTISGKWLLICISEIEQGVNSYRPKDYSDNQLLFDFKDDGKTGEIIGQTLMNQITGDYQLLGNQKMEVRKFGGTKIAETGWGDTFWKNIRSSTSYSFSSDSLLIYFDSDQKILKFIPKK